MSKRIWSQLCPRPGWGPRSRVFVIPCWLFYYSLIPALSHLVLLAHVAPPAHQDPDDARVAVPGAGVQGCVPVLKWSSMMIRVWWSGYDDQGIKSSFSRCFSGQVCSHVGAARGRSRCGRSDSRGEAARSRPGSWCRNLLLICTEPTQSDWSPSRPPRAAPCSRAEMSGQILIKIWQP